MSELCAGRKIINRDTAVKTSSDIRRSGKILVFTNGCFDILHPGHIDLLQKSRELGDCLMIGVNTDTSVRRIKGGSRPLNNEHDRAVMLAALEVVEWVVYFGEDTPEELIREIKPDILVKGGDYTPETVVGRETVERSGGRVVIIPLLEGYSTSALVEKIKTES